MIRSLKEALIVLILSRYWRKAMITIPQQSMNISDPESWIQGEQKGIEKMLRAIRLLHQWHSIDRVAQIVGLPPEIVREIYRELQHSAC